MSQKYYHQTTIELQVELIDPLRVKVRFETMGCVQSKEEDPTPTQSTPNKFAQNGGGGTTDTGGNRVTVFEHTNAQMHIPGASPATKKKCK